MAFVYVDFIKAYPEFAGIEQSAINYRGCFADRFVSDTTFGEFRTDAVFLFAAHCLAIEFNISSGLANAGKNSSMLNTGVASSISASNASLSQSFVNNSLITSDNPLFADLGRTVYGLRFLELLQMCALYGYVVLSPDTF